MATIKNQVSMSTSIGGRGGSATPGGYNQGLQFAASVGGVAYGVPATHKDLRGSSATPGGYNQGNAIMANKDAGTQGLTITNKDLRGGNSNPNTGYNQGPTFTATKK